MFSEVQLSTPSQQVSLRCNPNTDEVVISTTNRRGKGKALCLLSGNYRVEWVWEMTNQQGYGDGFRIQVASGKESRAFDIIAIASCLQIYETKRWNGRTTACTGRGDDA